MPSFPYYTEPAHVTGAPSGAGFRTTSTSSTEGRAVRDVADKISLLEPGKHPLVTLLTNVGKVYDGKAWSGSGMLKSSCFNTTIEWFEDVYGGRYCKVGGAGYAASGAVTITVTGAGSTPAHIFTVGDVFKNLRTGELMVVATVASTTTITVASADRASGSTAAAAGVSGDELLVIGSASGEGAAMRNANTTISSNPNNVTQIFRTSISVTGSQNAIKLYGGPDLRYQRAKKGTEHMLDIERAYWFGEKRSTTDAAGNPLRFTGGVHEHLITGGSFVQNQGGVLTAPDFNNFLREGFTYGNSQKVLMAGGYVLQSVNEFARGQIRTNVGDTKYGLAISKYQTAFGEINIIHNPLFIGDLAGYAYLLDLESFRSRYLDGRDTHLNLNIQANDVDGQVDEYLSECGLERKQAARHALLKGVLAT